MEIAQLAQKVLAEVGDGHGALGDIAARVGAGHRAVSTAAQTLKRRGLLESAGRGQFRLTDAGAAWRQSGAPLPAGHGGPRLRQKTSGLRQRAWWLMRKSNPPITLPVLLGTLADARETGAKANLGQYLRALVQAGFLRVLPNAPGNGVKRYRLERNNGRKAPVVRPATGAVYDPNTGETFALLALPGGAL
jgi:hypothetical protein